MGKVENQHGFRCRANRGEGSGRSLNTTKEKAMLKWMLHTACFVCLSAEAMLILTPNHRWIKSACSAKFCPVKLREYNWRGFHVPLEHFRAVENSDVGFEANICLRHHFFCFARFLARSPAWP